MAQATTRKRGRPVLGNNKLLQVKITQAEFDDLERMALLRRTTMSEIVRHQIRSLIASAIPDLSNSNNHTAA